MPCETINERDARQEREYLTNNPPIENPTTDELQEEYPKRLPNEPIPAYPFFISASTLDKRSMYARKAQRQIEMRNPRDFVDNYEDIRLQTFTGLSTSLPNALINIFNSISVKFGLNGKAGQPDATTALQYVITGTRMDTGEVEAIFALPQNINRFNKKGDLLYSKGFFLASQRLENYLQNTILVGKNASEPANIGLNKAKLLSLLSGTPPVAPVLVKQEGNSFSLQDLINRYGSAYTQLFSSPLIITGNDARFSERKLVGRTVLLYAKHPTGESVDDWVEREGISDSNTFGYIILDEEAAFHTLDELQSTLVDVDSRGSYGQRRLVVPNSVIKVITTLFSQGKYKDTFAEMFEDVTRSLPDGATVTTKWTNYALFTQLLQTVKDNPNLEREFNRILLAAYPKGVYISPALASSQELKAGIFAKVDQSSNKTRTLLYEKLQINGLANVINSVGSFPLDLKEDDYTDLFSVDNTAIRKVSNKSKTVIIHNNVADITQVAIHPPVGQEIKVIQAELLAYFQDDLRGGTLPINSSDLNNFVSSLSALVMRNNSQNLGPALLQQIIQENPC